MAISNELVRRVVNTMNDSKVSYTTTFGYGTVHSGFNNSKQVMMDGSNYSVPISLSTDAQIGDRVLVRIDNHEAVVIGNLTTPASARTATDFMRFENGGLIIGKLDSNGNPEGGYTVTGDSFYKIYDMGGDLLASFDVTGTTFYEDGVKVAEYSNNGIKFYKDEDIIAEMNAEGTTFYGKKYNGDPMVVGNFGKKEAVINRSLKMTDDSGAQRLIIDVSTGGVLEEGNGDDITVTASELAIGGGEAGAMAEYTPSDFLPMTLYANGITAICPIIIDAYAGSSIRFISPTSLRTINIGDYFATKGEVSSSGSSNAGTIKTASGSVTLSSNSESTTSTSAYLGVGTWVVTALVNFQTGTTTTGYRQVKLSTGTSSSSLSIVGISTVPGTGVNEYVNVTGVVNRTSSAYVYLNIKHTAGTSMTCSYSIRAVQVS